MESFIVSARKYRPATFSGIVGQENITDTLKNAIKSNHIAQSYLFCGPHGVGKTTCARILAKTLNCFNLTEETEACNKCDSCTSFNQTRSFNIHELDAASNNSVDGIRSLIEQVRIPPQVGKYSIYIIDEVHMLSSSAFNAFLKTLEEPPKHAIFILATTEKHKIIPTILSRCQIFDFKRIRVDDIVKYLQYVAKKESIKTDEGALNIIASKADGALRDALSIFDQIVSFTGDEINYEATVQNLNVLDYDYYFSFVHHFLKNDVTSAFIDFNSILEKGFDAQFFVNGLSEHFRNLLMCKDKETQVLLDIGQNIKLRYIEQANSCSQSFIYEALEITNQTDFKYSVSKNKRLLVELMLLKLSNILTHPEIKNEPITKVEKIEKEKPEIKKKTVEKKDDERKEKNVEKFQTISIRRPEKSQHTKSETQKKENKKEEQTKIDNENVESFSAQDVLVKMQEFVKKKEINQRTAATLLMNEPIIKDDFKICIKIGNSLQIKEIGEIKPSLLNFLRSKLQNSKITLETISDIDKKKNNKRPYTDEEKFKYLSQKNPALKELKQQFSLDFE